MLIANLFSSRTVRLIALATFVVGAISFAPSFVAPTLSCPGPPPQPLRHLYERSESIVIARVGETEITRVEKNGDDDENATTYLRTALLVSSTLKGEHQPVVYVEHIMYSDYKDQLSAATTGDKLLVFLNKVEGKGDYFVNMEYGVKKLSDADLKVYVSRIEDLASILKAENPSDTEIVEWLVRCAEEPATQWEGAFELETSHYVLEWEESMKARADEAEVSEAQPEDTASENVDVNGAVVSDDGFERDAKTTGNFARLLTKEQKYRLTTALISNETLNSSHSSLLNLAQRWDDPRLVPYLLAQLDLMARDGESDWNVYYFAEAIMTIVSDKLGDDALKAMVKRFSDNENEQAEYYDDAESEESEESEGSEVAATADVEQEAADGAAALRRRNAELQYFVTLALSTVPKTPAAELGPSPESAQP